MKIDWTKVKEGLTTMDILKEENKELKEQLQQKENIIKEVREYIENKVISNGEIIDQLRKIEIKELLEILDKESK